MPITPNTQYSYNSEKLGVLDFNSSGCQWYWVNFLFKFAMKPLINPKTYYFCA